MIRFLSSEYNQKEVLFHLLKISTQTLFSLIISKVNDKKSVMPYYVVFVGDIYIFHILCVVSNHFDVQLDVGNILIIG